MISLNTIYFSWGCIVDWQGPGWYAPRQENGETRYYFVGSVKYPPDTRAMELGTPNWIDDWKDWN